MIDLEDTARSPPSSPGVSIGHVEIGASVPRGVVARVKGDGALEEDWGRQLGGIVGGGFGLFGDAHIKEQANLELFHGRR
jgi:hypothetical protein